jgi:hypothetical protein
MYITPERKGDMLAYLDALLGALETRDTAEIDRLLAHPLARTLTSEALLEVQAVAASVPHRVPVRLLQLRQQTAHLLAGRSDASDRDETRHLAVPSGSRRGPTRHQMELPLPA